MDPDTLKPKAKALENINGVSPDQPRSVIERIERLEQRPKKRSYIRWGQPENRERFIAAARAAGTAHGTAARLGIALSTAYAVANRLGVTFERSHRSWPQADIDRVRTMQEAGWTYTEIAEATGRTVGSIAGALYRASEATGGA